MEGKGRIRLEGKDFEVEKGAGVYLGPSETAAIGAAGGALKLFHLVVPRIPKWLVGRPGTVSSLRAAYVGCRPALAARDAGR
jgi:hypothetical protein